MPSFDVTVTRQMEEYAAAIFRCAGEGRSTVRVSTGAVARALGVSAASVTYMFKRLATAGLAQYKGYSGILLTHAGKRLALLSLRRHRMTERFLVDVLGVALDRADLLAHEMDYAVPEEVADRMGEIMGHPLTCPHGHPIPQKDGTIVEFPTRPLYELTSGDDAPLARMEDDSPAVLRRIVEHGLALGVRLRMVEAAAEAVRVELGPDRRALLLEPDIAATLHVQREGEEPVRYPVLA